MDIGRFLDLGVEVETKISKIYEKIATLAKTADQSKTLISISKEERNHASSLRIGKNYLKEMPDIFLGIRLNEAELKAGLEDIGILQARLEKNLPYLEGLNWLIKLEKQFERVHIGTSVVLGDESLKKLFQALASGDQNHIKTLEELISSV